MAFRSIRDLFLAPVARSANRHARRANRWHAIEQLEDRVTPAAFYAGEISDFLITTDVNTLALDNGDTVTWNPQSDQHDGKGAEAGLTFGANAFTSIQAAINAASADKSGTAEVVYVTAGSYPEYLTVDSKVEIRGAKNSVTGQDATRGKLANETLITAPSFNTTPYLININAGATGSSFVGIAIDGSFSSTPNQNRGVHVLANDVTVSNNRVTGFAQRGVQYELANAATSGLIAGNLFDNIGTGTTTGYAATVFDSAGVNFINNKVTNADVGPAYQAAYGTAGYTISENNITARAVGLAIAEGGDTAAVTIANNTVTVTNAGGIAAQLTNLFYSTGVSLTNNTLSATAGLADTDGLLIFNVAAPLSISGGSVSNFTRGVQVTNVSPFGALPGGPPGSTAVTLTGVSLTGNATGVAVVAPDSGANNLSSNAVTTATLAAGTTITGNTTGVSLAGSKAAASLTGVNFDGAADNTTDVLVGAATAAGATTFGAGNSFAGDDYYVNNQSANAIDLTASQIYDVTGNFRIEDRIFHKVDDTTKGLVTFVTNNVYVTAPDTKSGTTTDSDSNIQRGINATAGKTGFTVNVEAGSFAQSVNVNQSVVLQGAGKASTTITAPANANAAVVAITAPNVTVAGFTLAVDQGAGVLRGVYGPNGQNWANALIQNSTVTTVGTTTDKQSRGILFESNGTVNNPVTIRASEVTGNGTSRLYRGISLFQVKTATVGGIGAADGNMVSNTVVRDLQIDFPAANGTTLVQNNTFAYAGINVTEPNDGHVVTITGNAITGFVNSGSPGLFVNHNTAGTVIVTGNAFKVPESPFAGYPSIGLLSGGSRNLTVTGNTFTPAAGATNYSLVVVDTQHRDGQQQGVRVPNSIDFRGNTLNGSGTVAGIGFAIYNGNSTQVSDTVTTPNTVPAFGTITLGGAGANANSFGLSLGKFIQLNAGQNPNFLTPVTGGKAGPVAVNIDATGNTFDVGKGQQLPSAMSLDGKFVLEQKIVHKPDDNALGLVTTTPSQFFVPNTQTIQRSINAASSGDTVTVQSGTYNESLTIPISGLSLIGPNAGISVGKNAGTRFDEAIVRPAANGDDIIRVTAPNVTIDGLTLDGFNPNIDGSGRPTVNGNAVNALYGVTNLAAGATYLSNQGAMANGLSVKNSVLQNLLGGVVLDGPFSTPQRAMVSDSRIQFITDDNDNGIGIGSFDNFYIDATGNALVLTGRPFDDGTPANSVNTSFGIWVQNNQNQGTGLAPGGAVQLSNNLITLGGNATGFFINNNFGNALAITGNAINAATGVVPDQFGRPRAIRVWSSIGNQTVTLNDNVIGATGGRLGVGYSLFNNGGTAASPNVTITGGSVANADIGVAFDSNVGFEGGANYASVTGTNITGAVTGVRARSTAAASGSQELRLANLTITLQGGGIGVSVSDAINDGFTTTVGLSGVAVTNGATGVLISGPDAELTGNTFANIAFNGQTGDYITLANGAYNAVANSGAVLDAGQASFNSVVGNSATLAQAFAIEDKITDQLNDSTLGFVQLQPNKAFVTAASPAGVIQRAINAEGITAGGKVYVQAGTYNEDIDINVAGLTLLGESRLSRIVGQIGGPSSNTVRISASNVTLDGFEVTREGNNAADYNNSGQNLYGVNIENAAQNVLVSNNLVTGNRNGVYIDNAGNVVIRNNVITNNRTGVHRVDTGVVTITENVIADNFTLGILLRDDSVSAAGRSTTIFNNSITGNFYGGIVHRQSGAAAPVNAAGNWFGTNTPVYFPGNSQESTAPPNFVPAVFGGSFTNPGGAPDVIESGATSQVDFTPFLFTGTDTNVETVVGRGKYGFQGDFTQLGVTADGAQAGTTGRVNEAIGYNNSSAKTVNVLAGTYPEAVDVNRQVGVKLFPNGAATAVVFNSLAGVAAASVDINGTNLTVGDATDTTFAGGLISGGGNLVKVGTGTLTLSGGSSFGGATAVKAGTLNLIGSLGGPVNVNSGGTLAGTGIVGGLLTNGGTVSPGGAAVGMLTLNGGYTQLPGGTLQVDIGTSGSDNLDITGAVKLAGNLAIVRPNGFMPTPFTKFQFITNDASDAVNGTFVGFAQGAPVDINGQKYIVDYAGGNGNDVVLVAVSSTAGAVTSVVVDDDFNGVAVGTTVVADDGSSRTVGFDAFATIQGGISALDKAAQTPPSLRLSGGTYNAAVVVDRKVAITLQSDTKNAAGDATQTVNTVTVASFDDANGRASLALNKLTFAEGSNGGSTAMAGAISGVGTFVKQGNGVLTFSGPHTYNGATQVNGGTLTAASDEVIPDFSAVTVASGATLDLTSFSETIGSLAGAGNVKLNNALLTVGRSSTNTIFSGVISDDKGLPGQLVKVGAGTLTLTGANTYTGGTSIEAGTLQLGNGGTTGSVDGDIDTTSGFLAINRSDDLAFGQLVTGGGGVIQNGTGSLQLTNTANSYTGGTVVNAGTLKIADNATLGAASGSVTVNAPGKALVTENVTSGRAFFLNGGATLSVAGGKTLIIDGGQVNGGLLAGPGTLVTRGGTIVTGATIAAGATVTVDGGSASFNNIVNNGKFVVVSGANTANLTSFVNGSGGQMSISGMANVSGFSSIGLLEVLSGGVFANVGTSDLVFGGGSLTYLGTITTDGSADGGTISLGAASMTVSGGIVRNNGTISGPAVPLQQRRKLVLDNGSTLFRANGTLNNVTVQTKNGSKNSPGFTS